jgi:hypothetical protein
VDAQANKLRFAKRAGLKRRPADLLSRFFTVSNPFPFERKIASRTDPHQIDGDGRCKERYCAEAMLFA